MVGGADDTRDRRQRLATLIRQQASGADCWERAETVIQASALRTRLEEIGVTVTADVAAGLMAAAMLLAAGSEEFGGDYRDALGDLAALGLELFDG